MRLWARHRCPPDVEITVTMDGQVIVGPMTGEHMAFVCLYTAGNRDQLDLLGEIDRDATWTFGRVQLLARYVAR